MLKARLQWAHTLGIHSQIDTRILKAYAVPEHRIIDDDPADDSITGSVTSSLKHALSRLSVKVRKHPIVSSAACVAAGALTAAWFYGYQLTAAVCAHVLACMHVFALAILTRFAPR